MSSTRRAKDESTFQQARYASSPAFERGLLANLVAKRCALIDAPEDRELIWFIHYLSHQSGGLGAFVNELITRYPERFRPRSIEEVDAGEKLNADQVQEVCRWMPNEEKAQFPLKGNTAFLENYCADDDGAPDGYRAAVLFERCLAFASQNLEKELSELCLDPETGLSEGPWYFPSMVETVREYKADFIKRKGAGVVITALGKKVCETLDYTAYGRGLTLLQGDARRGKSFAAKSWCVQHPGLARFIEVPPSNDEVGFFRALARGLGLGSFLNYKAAEIRDRVESVLLAGDLLLVLDEAQRLWPQSNYRQAFPRRIVWVMAMANAGVPIALISTPQFIETQKAVEKTGWNSAQLTGRISHYECLPADLSPEDLMAVAKSVLPECTEKVLRALAIYARSSARYLAAIDSISKRARYLAAGAGRDTATTDDVRQAMQESVIPADTKLQSALAAGRKPKPLAALAPAMEWPEADRLPSILRPGSSPEVLAPPPSRSRGSPEAVLNGQ
jgi:hypothetical protein